MTTSSASKMKRRRIIALIIFLALVGWGVALLWQYAPYITNVDELRRAIESTGLWAPLVFMLINMVQVIIAPVPGSIVTMAGGVMFGPVLGITLSMIASTIGFMVVFWLAKRYGRRLWGFFVSSRHNASYNRAMRSPRTLTFVTLTFLLPVIPDPVAAYVAGLTPVSTRKLLLICVLARFPGVAMTVLVASYAAEQNYALMAGLLVLLVVFLVLVYIYRVQVDRLVAKLYR